MHIGPCVYPPLEYSDHMQPITARTTNQSNMNQNDIITYDLRSALRGRKVTIRAFAKSVGLPMTRVRWIFKNREMAYGQAQVYTIHIRRLAGVE